MTDKGFLVRGTLSPQMGTSSAIGNHAPNLAQVKAIGQQKARRIKRGPPSRSDNRVPSSISLRRIGPGN